ncbi:MAG: methionine biosynthesis protein MetW [Candidatus Gastranaerophilales bacterium]|nr:methionine biosynthesis protein MetW [Candidatus Gastranaerophilales bacterium]
MLNRHYAASKGLHLNYSIIEKIIEENSRVLDLGCGNGYLLKLLKDKKNVKGNGIEISQNEVIRCLEKGLSVIQGDIDEGLKQISDKYYDYVILNQTLQSAHNPDFVLEEMLRAGKKCIVSFPNFAYWKVRFNFFFTGNMPKSRVLPFEWYNTPNIHLLTIKDFFEYAKKNNIKILEGLYTTKAHIRKGIQYNIFSNFFAEEAIFVISRD